MEKSFVYLDLKPHLRDYLYHEFGADPDADGVDIDLRADIGKIILSMVTVVSRPPKCEIKDNPVKVFLPTLEWNHYLLRDNFLTIPEWRQKMLANYIEASFRLKMREFFLIGYEKGHPQKLLTEAFCQTYGITENSINFEAVKKYDYRNRQRIKREVRQSIQLALQFA